MKPSACGQEQVSASQVRRLVEGLHPQQERTMHTLSFFYIQGSHACVSRHLILAVTWRLALREPSFARVIMWSTYLRMTMALTCMQDYDGAQSGPLA